MGTRTGRPESIDLLGPLEEPLGRLAQQLQPILAQQLSPVEELLGAAKGPELAAAEGPAEGSELAAAESL